MTPWFAPAIVRRNVNRLAEEEPAMEPMLIDENELDVRMDEDVLVHEWRAEQLRGLGVPRAMAEEFADLVDWRAVAALVERGCPARLALDIVR